MTFEQYVQEVEKHMERELPFDVYEQKLNIDYRTGMLSVDVLKMRAKKMAEFIDRDILDREILKADENR